MCIYDIILLRMVKISLAVSLFHTNKFGNNNSDNNSITTISTADVVKRIARLKRSQLHFLYQLPTPLPSLLISTGAVSLRVKTRIVVRNLIVHTLYSTTAVKICAKGDTIEPYTSWSIASSSCSSQILCPALSFSLSQSRPCNRTLTCLPHTTTLFRLD